MSRPWRGPTAQPEVATPREREVLRLLAFDLTNADIASLLQISTRTVESHIASLMRKYDVHRRRLLPAHLASTKITDTAPTPDNAAELPAPVNTAVLDRDGVIVGVNASWERFCIANGGDLVACGAGASYLQACRAGGDRQSLTVAAYIRLAVRGGVFVPLQTRIPCHSPTKRSYYDLLVSTRVDDGGACVGATVSSSEAHRSRARSLRSEVARSAVRP